MSIVERAIKTCHNKSLYNKQTNMLFSDNNKGTNKRAWNRGPTNGPVLL